MFGVGRKICRHTHWLKLSAYTSAVSPGNSPNVTLNESHVTESKVSVFGQ